MIPVVHAAERVPRRPNDRGLREIRYGEKYGEAAEKKLKRDLAVGGKELERIRNLVHRKETP